MSMSANKSIKYTDTIKRQARKALTDVPAEIKVRVLKKGETV